LIIEKSLWRGRATAREGGRVCTVSKRGEEEEVTRRAIIITENVQPVEVSQEISKNGSKQDENNKKEEWHEITVKVQPDPARRAQNTYIGSLSQPNYSPASPTDKQRGE